MMDKYFKYKYDDLFNPTLKALKKLGGSGAVSEIEEEVAQILNLSEDAINEIGVDFDLLGNPAPEPTAETRGKIKWYLTNLEWGGHEYDGQIITHNGNAPEYNKFCFIHAKGSNNDEMSVAAKDNVNPPYDILEIGNVQTKEEIKTAIETKKDEMAQ